MLSNAGQANAATGAQGYEDAVNCATIAAASLGVTPDDILLMSTGEGWRYNNGGIQCYSHSKGWHTDKQDNIVLVRTLMAFKLSTLHLI